MKSELVEHKKNTFISMGSLCGMSIAFTIGYIFGIATITVVFFWALFIVSAYNNRAILFN